MKYAKNKIFIPLAALILFFPLLSNSNAQQEQSIRITAEGRASIKDENTVAARDSAIENAMEKAVEMAVAKIISSETIAENFQLISDKIYSNAKGYIKKFNVSQETIVEGEYLVTIDSYIAHAFIFEELTSLKILAKRENMPRVIMFVSELGVDSDKYRFWWGKGDEESGESIKEEKIESAEKDKGMVFVGTAESEMSKRFMEKGFMMVNKDTIIKSLINKPLYNKAELDDQEIIELTRQTNIEIIIIGKALVKVMGNIQGTEMKSILGNVSARAIDRNGRLIVSESASAKGLHVDEKTGADDTLKKAAVLLADKLIGKIVPSWAEETGEQTAVNLKLSGMTYKRLQTLLKILKDDIRGVSNIVQRSFTSGGRASIDIDMQGNASYLANELTRLEFPDIEIEVTSFTENNIELTLKDKTGNDSIINPGDGQ